MRIIYQILDLYQNKIRDVVSKSVPKARWEVDRRKEKLAAHSPRKYYLDRVLTVQSQPDWFWKASVSAWWSSVSHQVETDAFQTPIQAPVVMPYKRCPEKGSSARYPRWSRNKHSEQEIHASKTPFPLSICSGNRNTNLDDFSFAREKCFLRKDSNNHSRSLKRDSINQSINQFLSFFCARGLVFILLVVCMPICTHQKRWSSTPAGLLYERC